MGFGGWGMDKCHLQWRSFSIYVNSLEVVSPERFKKKPHSCQHPMNLADFNKSVEGIFLFPGSLEELHQRKGNRPSLPVRYEYIINPLQGNLGSLLGELYLTGFKVPTIEEYDAMMLMQQGLAGKIASSVPMLSKAAKRWEGSLLEFYTLREVQEQDIRVKAKKVGAAGIIHFQPYLKELYMGAAIRCVPT